MPNVDTVARKLHIKYINTGLQVICMTNIMSWVKAIVVILVLMFLLPIIDFLKIFEPVRPLLLVALVVIILALVLSRYSKRNIG